MRYSEVSRVRAGAASRARGAFNMVCNVPGVCVCPVYVWSGPHFPLLIPCVCVCVQPALLHPRCCECVYYVWRWCLFDFSPHTPTPIAYPTKGDDAAKKAWMLSVKGLEHGGPRQWDNNATLFMGVVQGSIRKPTTQGVWGDIYIVIDAHTQCTCTHPGKQ